MGYLQEQLDRRKFTVLLFSILVMALLPILLVDADAPGGLLPWSHRLLGLLWGVVLIAAVHAVSDKRRRLAVLSTAAIVVFGGRIASMFGSQLRYRESIDAGSYATSALFLFGIVFLVYRAILRTRRVRGDTVMGAISVYLLLGYAYANLHALVWHLNNEAFRFPDNFSMDAGTLVPEFTFGYYSFVTLTTLGYGDIVPISFAARTVSWVEAVTGVVYMATVIAFLVSQVVVDREAGRSL